MDVEGRSLLDLREKAIVFMGGEGRTLVDLRE
jgi:hypothetical protein